MIFSTYIILQIFLIVYIIYTIRKFKKSITDYVIYSVIIFIGLLNCFELLTYGLNIQNHIHITSPLLMILQLIILKKECKKCHLKLK